MIRRPRVEDEPEEIEEIICGGCDEYMEKISTEEGFICRDCGVELQSALVKNGDET